MRSLIVLYSYHHNNTEKVARAFAKVLNARIKAPEQVNPEELQEYDLVGFGSGIYGAKHHKSLLVLGDKLPQVTNKKAFLFSTNGVPASVFQKTPRAIAKDHQLLREKLQSKGYVIIGEFACPGFNSNSFLKYFGGINKGRPNAEDLKLAEEFAQNIKKNFK